jgi:hypothetical protein
MILDMLVCSPFSHMTLLLGRDYFIAFQLYFWCSLYPPFDFVIAHRADEIRL